MKGFALGDAKVVLAKVVLAKVVLAGGGMLAGVALAEIVLARPAWAIDWASVPAKSVDLFHPGQSSWEYMLTMADHSGASRFRQGKTCRACHDGEEKSQGLLLSSGQKNEPHPMVGRAGFLPARVQIAHDATALHIRVQFSEGQTFDTRMDPDWATKVTVMLADDKVPEAARAGCWIACHEDQSKMPADHMADRSKYLSKTRLAVSRTGGGDAMKSTEDLAALFETGHYLEYWQAKIAETGKAQAVAGTVFDKRQDSKTHPVTVKVSQEGSGTTLILSRPLMAGPPWKALVPGAAYTLGFAIHTGHSARRFHYVSYEYSFALEQGNADLVSVRQ